MFRYLLIAIFLLPLRSMSQNLVPNGDFENFTACPTTPSQYYLTPPWSRVHNAAGTPDYMNACVPQTRSYSVPSNLFGYQQPVSGNGYYGLIVYYESHEVREYLRVKLKTPLLQGQRYQVGFHVSRGDSFRFAVDQFGAFLSKDSLQGPGNESALGLTPQISNPPGKLLTNSTGWTKISGLYTANGGEEYITIGNFKNDSSSLAVVVDSSSPFRWAYYYLDDVFVIPDSIKITGEDTICLGDSLHLTVSGQASVNWANAADPEVIIGQDSLLSTAPKQTTTFLAYGLFDTTSFTVNVIPIPEPVITGDTSICSGQTLLLRAFAPGAEYLWQDGSTSSSLVADAPGIYWVQSSNTCGSSLDTIVIAEMDCEALLKMPNVFSPNNDGINDLFSPVNIQNIRQLELAIFSRWGKQVFQTHNKDGGWDGRSNGNPCSSGTYYWTINYVDLYGQKVSDSGFLTLMR